MSNPRSETTGGGTVIPTLRYKDAPAAIDFLCQAFGFQRRLVVPADDGQIAHAQLTHSTGMVMVSSDIDTPYSEQINQPRDLGGGLYVVVHDIRAHYEQAKQAGADIVLELEEQSYGGYSYTCRDCEGLLWSFGSYNPWNPA